ncbi:hypothetical protein VNI00_010931 [Paramarasmius palmivorus]|uniref:Uncharacterized protein n=1 Tax=Paramarasmius palmivorus TaxID=297713 RepID=A0AAW0CHH8_9AGAR
MRLIYILIFRSLACASFGLASQAYEPVREYAGKDFFMGWDIDANVSYIDQDATPQEILTYVDSSTGHAIIRAGNTLDSGSVHGGSVLPSFLAPGSDLSGTGEFRLIGGIDGTTANQRQPPANYVEQPQSPKALATDANCNHQIDWKLDSERGKGGVFALRIDVDEMVMWFWNHQDIPSSIAQAQVHALWDIDSSSWGEPKMVYPAARDGYDVKLDTEQARFRPQKLVLGVAVEHVGDRTSQGKGYAKTYAEPGECAIQSNGSAYWEISHIRIFAQAQNPGQKPERQLLARRSQAGMDITSSKTTSISSLSLIVPSGLNFSTIVVMRPPRPTLFNPTTPTSSSVTSTTVTSMATFGIFDPAIETSQVPTSTSTDASVITQGDIGPTVTTSTTSSQGHSENRLGISSSTTSQAGQDSEITSTVPNVTLGGSARSITVTFGEGGAGLVSFAGSSVSLVDGAITSTMTGSSGSGTPSSSSRVVDGTPTSLTSGALVNTDFVTGVDVLVVVVGSLLLMQ